MQKMSYGKTTKNWPFKYWRRRMQRYDLSLKTFELLSNEKSFNFGGNCEGKTYCQVVLM